MGSERFVLGDREDGPAQEIRVIREVVDGSSRATDVEVHSAHEGYTLVAPRWHEFRHPLQALGYFVSADDALMAFERFVVDRARREHQARNG